MKLRTLTAAALALSLSSGLASANNYTRAGVQTGYFAAGSPAFYNPFRGHHSAHWWRVVFLNALASLQHAGTSVGAGGSTGGGTSAGGGGTSAGGGKGAPGPVAGAGLPFLAVAGAAYLIRRRRSAAA